MKKLSCIFGNHYYRDRDTELTYLHSFDDMNHYMISMRCVDCGKVKHVQIAIPEPGTVNGIVEVMSE